MKAGTTQGRRSTRTARRPQALLAAASLLIAPFASAGAVAAPASDAVTAFALSTANGKRTATLLVSGGGASCKLGTASFDTAAIPLPEGVTFPDGLLDFRATDCAKASTLRFTLTLSTPLPEGAAYWRYGRTADNRSPHWYQLPARFSGNTVTFAISDGGLGDDDLAADGSIGGAGGIGVGIVPIPKAPGGLVAVGGNDHVSLRWTAAAAATSYTVKRAEKPGGPYGVVETQPGTQYTDKTGKNGTMYYYTVSAGNSAGESTDAAEVYAMPVAPKVATACGVEPVTRPRARACPRYTTGQIIEQEVYVCEGTKWKSTGWRVKESACGPVDLGPSPAIEG